MQKKHIQLTKSHSIEPGDKIPYDIDDNGNLIYVFNIGTLKHKKKLNKEDFQIVEEPGGTEDTKNLVSKEREKLYDKQARDEAGRGAAAQIHNQTLKSIRRYLFNWMKLTDHAKIELKKYIKPTNAIIVDDSHGEKATIIETAQEIYYSQPKINIIAAVTMFDEP